MPRSDSAVSPVVAALLILALTIVLAGIFGAFAMGLINPAALTGKIVGVTAESYGTDTDHGVRMTYWGGKDADQLVSVRAEVGSYGLVMPDGSTKLTDLTIGKSYDFSLEVVNETYDESGTKITTTRILNAGALVGEQVAFVGTFRDGTEQVIYLWKISVPGVNVDPGEFSGGDTNISISGFSNSTDPDGNPIPGHGIRVEKINSAVDSVELVGIKLSRVVDNGGDYIEVSNAIATSPLKAAFNGNKAVYFSTLQTYTGGGEKTPELEPGFSLSNALSGSVTLKVYISGKYAYTKEYNVRIPARVCTFNDDNHTAEITSVTTESDGQRLIIVLNAKTKNYIIGDGKASYKIYIGDALAKTGMVDVSGQTQSLLLNMNPRLDRYPDNAIMNIYFNYKVTLNEKTTVWYLVATRTVGEIKKLPSA